MTLIEIRWLIDKLWDKYLKPSYFVQKKKLKFSKSNYDKDIHKLCISLSISTE